LVVSSQPQLVDLSALHARVSVTTYIKSLQIFKLAERFTVSF